MSELPHTLETGSRGIEKPLVDGLVSYHLGGGPAPDPWLNWRVPAHPSPTDPVVGGRPLRPGGSPNQRALSYARALLSAYDAARPAVLAWYRYQATEGGIDLEEGASGYLHYHQAASASVALSALERGDAELAHWAGGISAMRLALLALHSDLQGRVRIPGPRWRWPGTNEVADVLVQDARGLPLTRPPHHPWWHDPGHQRRSLAAHLTRRLRERGVALAGEPAVAARARLRWPIHHARLPGGGWVAWTPELAGWDNLQPLARWQPAGGLAGELLLRHDQEQVWEASGGAAPRDGGIELWIDGLWGRDKGAAERERRQVRVELRLESEPTVLGHGRWPEPEGPDPWPSPPSPPSLPPADPQWDKADHQRRLLGRAIESRDLEAARHHHHRLGAALEGRLS